MEIKNARMQILIPEELKEKIKKCADQNKMSMNELVNKAVNAYVKRYTK